ncbi:TetR/AcrR family transcriptional regulator C-terminal domain-containing protein [Bifidobacterium apri]|uniref:TetR/AcrR family transcriptional regulator n=1 Tax=Bifidobacterium apri TaxID=1769423 RepID=UPI0039924F27
MPRERTDNARTIVTRRNLQNTVVKLLQAKPLQTINVKEVCSQAGINRSTFYNYYDNIADLVTDIEHETLEWMDHMIAKAFKATQQSDLEPVIVSICQYAADNKDRVQILLSLKADPQFRNKLVSKILDYSNWHAHAPAGAAQANSADSADLRLLFCIAGGLGLVQAWVDDEFSATPETIAHAIYTQSLPPAVRAMAQNPAQQPTQQPTQQTVQQTARSQSRGYGRRTK